MVAEARTAISRDHYFSGLAKIAQDNGVFTRIAEIHFQTLQTIGIFFCSNINRCAVRNNNLIRDEFESMS